MRYRTKLALIFGAVFVSMSYLPKMFAENNLATGSLSSMYLSKLNEMNTNKSNEWLKSFSINYEECKTLFEKNKVTNNAYKDCKYKIDSAYMDYAINK